MRINSQRYRDRWKKPTAYSLLLSGLMVGVLWFGSSVQSQQDGSSFTLVGNQRSGVRLTSPLVTLQVTVTDAYGRFIKGLRPHHFSIYDNNVRQQIAFFSNEDLPLSLGIIYDTSGSMRGIMRDALKALHQFMETSNQDDEFFLIGFNSRPELLEDFTRQADRIVSSLALAQPKGRTALYDAAYMGLEKVRRGNHSKRALLIISDGQDNNSVYNYRQLRRRVKESEVLVYAIGILDTNDEIGLQTHGFEVLGEITQMTGGRVFYPRNGPELANVCAHIASELRRQYSLGFYPQGLASDNQWHKLKIKVQRPQGISYVKVRAREGYLDY